MMAVTFYDSPSLWNVIFFEPFPPSLPPLWPVLHRAAESLSFTVVRRYERFPRLTVFPLLLFTSGRLTLFLGFVVFELDPRF